ncbi:uncharacterized protein LOC123290765 [Chrysoperla carnea]|uniref:uncharacterized protein LOC123290765 n=1 Tax=Chrysoperla carnea TaxID=189513 RepID=UPI001D090269|nr:uncharacterized protein LOC123290765 [Chrysoperla carnea]
MVQQLETFKEPLSMKKVESKLKISSFKIHIQQITTKLNVIKMKNSILIWIGDASLPAFNDLSLSIQNRYDNTILKTSILGKNDESLNLAARLCKKLNKQVYVSLNVFNEIGMPIILAVEKMLYEIIKNNPDCF